MRWPWGDDPWRPATRTWIITAAVLLVGGGLIGAGLQDHHPLAAPTAPSAPSVRPPTTSRTTAPGPATVSPAVVIRSVPMTLSIPAIGLTGSLTGLGLNPDGTIQLPSNVQQAGWYKLGPSPGQVGSAVIVGHVDSYRGPAVFFKLRDLVAGDQVDVVLADGTATHFVVTAVVTYPKLQFPAQLVYGPHGTAELQLVTCGGVFDAKTGSYLSNVVAYTSLVSATGPAA